jgi:hypothetical protein
MRHNRQRSYLRRTFKAPTHSLSGSPSPARASWIMAIGRTAAKGTSIIPVPYQCTCIGCSPGKHPDTGTMAPGSDDDSRDSVHGRRSRISVWQSERPRRHERQDRRRAPRAVQRSTTETLQRGCRRRQTTACCMSWVNSVPAERREFETTSRVLYLKYSHSARAEDR